MTEKTIAAKMRLQAKAKNPYVTRNTVFKSKEKTCGLTAGVTCAGVGTVKPSNQKNAKVCETAWDVRRIPSVRCTFC